MQHIKINSIAKQGSEAYLLLLLACDANNLHEGLISAEAFENYLEQNPEEMDFFDEDMVQDVKRRIRETMAATSPEVVQRSLEHSLHRLNS